VPAVLVTHHAGEAIALGDRLVRFERGRTVAAGDPGALLVRRDGLTITGTRRGPPEALGEGRALVRLDGATIEGPEERIGGQGGGALRLDLP
jgi:molybdate transport system ATP-binding protein